MSNAVDAAIAVLEETGFLPDGQTHEETVRVPTTRSPLFGRSGGELRTFGGRARFRHSTGWFATVGPRKVCLYRREELGGFQNVATRDTEALREALRTRVGVGAEAAGEIVGADNSVETGEKGEGDGRE